MLNLGQNHDLENLIIFENNDTAIYRIYDEETIIVYSSVFSAVYPQASIDSTLSSNFVLQFKQNHIDTLSIEGRISLVSAPVDCAENQKDLLYHPLKKRLNNELILEEYHSTGISCAHRILTLVY